MWSQLVIVDGIVCRCYRPDLTSTVITVPLLPPSLRARALEESHNGHSSGHLGAEKTLFQLQKEGTGCIWQKTSTSFARNVHNANRQNYHNLLGNISVRRPWQMIAVDVLARSSTFCQEQSLLVGYSGLFYKMGRSNTYA